MSLTNLINACVRIIGDEVCCLSFLEHHSLDSEPKDASVRRAVLTFFAWLLPQISYVSLLDILLYRAVEYKTSLCQEDILPHSQLLLLFTTSAQTHIFPEIRIDAIRFLNIFLEHIPNAVITGWNADNNGHGARVLEGYLGILNAGTKFGEGDGWCSTRVYSPDYLIFCHNAGQLQATSTASVVITPAVRHFFVASLSQSPTLLFTSPNLSFSSHCPRSSRLLYLP